MVSAIVADDVAYVVGPMQEDRLWLYEIATYTNIHSGVVHITLDVLGCQIIGEMCAQGI
jgi:hypothetical protein